MEPDVDWTLSSVMPFVVTVPVVAEDMFDGELVPAELIAETR
ncbi:hypothetical protein DYY66_2275 [Candidatus Nitrosotalea sp. FS]|nr:hypothetical protein [Candidatus Nitrosotalea sp. FS]